MDREKVIKALEYCVLSEDCRPCEYWMEFDDTGGCQIMKDALAMLKEQEVKTGYWIDSAGNDKCSICGEEYSDLYPDYGKTHFCPNCGAKMEGR